MRVLPVPMIPLRKVKEGLLIVGISLVVWAVFAGVMAIGNYTLTGRWW